MKRHLLLVPVILATTAAIADTQAIAPSSRADAQAQAAALLNRPHAFGLKGDEVRTRSPSHTSTTADAQAQAAPASADAHAQAAALLSGYRASPHSRVETERTQGSAHKGRPL
jgi:hypothetical protein